MKKLPTLHIINGDASVPTLTAAAFPGQQLVWREILSEGPALAMLPEAAFWQKRKAYITAAYGEPEAVYQTKVMQEVQKLQQAKSFFEVVLWFDADLMCQVNLLFVLQMLQQSRPLVISVCVPSAGKNIGLMTAQELQQLFESRQPVQEEQLAQAAALWQLYGGVDPMALQRYLLENTVLLPHLQQALNLHLQRFPFCNLGLNRPQLCLLRIISEGISATPDIMKNFWEREPAYGYGDSQLLQELQVLNKVFINQKDNMYTLTLAGEAVLSGNSAENQSHDLSYWVGGVQVKTASNSLCWNPNKEQLEQV